MATLPNMNLIIPTPTVTFGPDWAQQLNAALALVDAHDHSSGKGAKVTPTGLNINADLSLGSNNLTFVRSVRLNSQAAVLALPGDVGSFSNVNGNLHWNNNGGTPVQLTNGGSPSTSTDGISRSFSEANIASNTTINAAATVSMYLINTNSSITMTLPAANAVAAGRFYEFKDYVGLAATNNITVTPNGIDQINNVNAAVVLNYAYAGLRVVSNGVDKWDLFMIPGTLQIATAQIANGAVTQAKKGPLNYGISTSCAVFSTPSPSLVDVTNLSVTITTTGRPVVLMLVQDGTAGASQIYGFRTPTASPAVCEILLGFTRGGSLIAQSFMQSDLVNLNSSVSYGIPASSFQHFDPVAAGTYTYKAQIAALTTSTSAVMQYAKLVAYEL